MRPSRQGCRGLERGAHLRLRRQGLDVRPDPRHPVHAPGWKIDLRFVEHLNSCCKQCIAIAGVLKEVFGSRIPFNLDHLIAGSLLADVGKMLEFEKDASGRVIKGIYGDMLRHPFSGVALCYKHHLPAEVMHIVATTPTRATG